MRMTVYKKGASVRIVALAVGAGMLTSLAFAAPSFAVEPAGTACQTDGKIAGRGATFSKKSWDAFATGYSSDVCGPVAGGPTEVGTKMSIYNYLAATSRTPKLTGSGNGIKAAYCRSDAFAGTDTPYTGAQLTAMRGAVPAPTSTTPGLDCLPLNGTPPPPFTPPFAPLTAPFPDPTDAEGELMSFPVNGGAVAIGIRLTAAACGGTAPTAINLTSLNASRLFGGQVANWNSSPGPVNDNPSLANCSIPVKRVVRLDNSGTTTIFKNYLANADGARALCDPTNPKGNTWEDLRPDNIDWPARRPPADPVVPVAGCSELLLGDGNPGVAAKVLATDGAVGYGDLADIRASATVLAGVRNKDNTAYVSPAQGLASNCSFAGAGLPGDGTNEDAVGRNGDVNSTWAVDVPNNKSDVTFKGNGYPACGFTWVMIWANLSGDLGPSPIARLSDNQRRTVYSFMTYALSPAAQSKMGPVGYAPLPATFLTSLRLGFQDGF